MIRLVVLGNPELTATRHQYPYGTSKPAGVLSPSFSSDSLIYPNSPALRIVIHKLTLHKKHGHSCSQCIRTNLMFHNLVRRDAVVRFNGLEITLGGQGVILCEIEQQLQGK